MKIIEVNQNREPQPGIIDCPNCLEPMSYRLVEDLWTFFNYDKDKKVFYKHVDGTITKRYYECLQCGHELDAYRAEGPS